MKKLQSFNSTPELFDYIISCLGAGDGDKTREAGALFEQYTQLWHMEFSDYVAVYDANDVHSIPSHIIDKIDAWKLLSKGANSFGIDKICLTRYGEIDVHQDKSTLHTDKKLSTDKAAKMMSLYNNPLKNIRNFVINTTAQDLSHYAKLWSDKTPLCFGYDSFVADEADSEAQLRDERFWTNLRAKDKKSNAPKIYGFISRGPEQDDYINAGLAFARKAMQDHGNAKWHQLGCGALGKSVLDAVMLAELEGLFNPVYTKTPKPVSVSFYHSSKTLPKNGWEEVQRRRAKGIYDEVIVVSGTNVVDGESDNHLSTRFAKTTSIADAVVKIKTALDNNRSVLLLTLYHHAKEIEGIARQMNHYYKGFKYWYRKRDECDWPCRNADSNYSPALDQRTESILTFGSSGTERLGKDPIADYGLNNINIHGICAHKFTWSQAEDAGLVKPLILIMPNVRESDVARMFPEFVDNNGRVDWSLKVKGVPVDNVMPTARLIADLVALAKTLVEYPEVKRILTFSNMVRQNKLAEVNWPWVCKLVLDNSNLSKNAKKLFWQVLNDDDFNSVAVKDHNVAIKRAKAHDRYAIGSCKVFDRGYDDKFSPKHHASIHLDPRNIVSTVQGIWRTTRNDFDTNGKPVGGDPNSYYILPMTYNDLGDEPSWSEDRMLQLMGILQQNKNIYEEFQSLIQQPGGGRKGRIGQKNGKIWIPLDFDPSAFSNLVTFVATTSKGKAVESLMVEAHTWLLERYLAISNLTHFETPSINEEWLAIEKFQPLFETYKMFKNKPKTFREHFFGGKYARIASISQETKDVIERNLIEYKLHKQACQDHRNNIKVMIADYCEKFLPTVIIPDSNYLNISMWAEEQFGVPKHFVNPVSGPIITKWFTNKEHYRQNQRYLYNLIYQAGQGAPNAKEWVNQAYKLLQQSHLSTYRVAEATIERFFVGKDKYKALTTKEYELILALRKEIRSRACSIVRKGQVAWNAGQTKDTDERLRLNGIKIKKSLKKFHAEKVVVQ